MFSDAVNRTATVAVHTVYEVNHLWGTWNLHVMIFLSFLLQILLTLCSPLRKRTSEAYVIQFIISAFVLADSTTQTSMGLYSGSGTSVDIRVQTLWSCFLLLHLGGPDSITASSFEDITTCVRSILTLLAQAIVIFYSRALLTLRGNILSLPTILVLASGVFKIMERLMSLRFAHPDAFRKTLLPMRDRDERHLRRSDNSHPAELQLPTSAQAIHSSERPGSSSTSCNHGEEFLAELQVVASAYKLFEAFKGLIVDFIPSSKACRESRRFFLERTSRDAFQILVVELHFLYDIMYTKANLIAVPLAHSLRFLALSCICLATVFFFAAYKQGLRKLEIVSTYVLLLGTVSLEVVAILMMLLSDWGAVYLSSLSLPLSSSRKILLRVIKTLRWSSHYANGKDPVASAFSFRWLLQRNRFSHCLNQDSLIRLSLHPPEPVPFFGGKLLLKFGNPKPDPMFDFSVEKAKVNRNLREVVFSKLKEKPEAKSRMNSSTIRGDWIFNESNGCLHLLPLFDDFEFDKAVLVWNIATELCCFENSSSTTDEGGSIGKGGDSSSLRTACKLLSDYVFYLLADEKKMLSPIAGIYDLRIICTCRELDGLFSRHSISRIKPKKKKGCFRTSINCLFTCCCKDEPVEDKYNEIQRKVCRLILDGDTDPESPAEELSVLSDARSLAKALIELGEERKWETITKLWVEFLSYAALSCPGGNHAAKLCQGGEFLSLVWLLSAHLGLGKQYKLNSDEEEGPK